MKDRFSYHFALLKKPLGILFALCLAFWSRVLFTGQVLLPGAMLGGFAPFGGQQSAPWTILQWDALAQYFPWRHFAAQSLTRGEIPLWNPFQFSGTPFVANAQSAVFYPLNFPFWIFDTAFAFGIAAFLHSVLASFSTYFLARRWNLSRAGAVLAAAIYAFCGYLSAWALLPTLFATASWLPLCLLLFEKASDDEKPGAASVGLSLALACALLAGHAQIFFYILLALALRQPFLRRKWRGLALLCGSLGLAVSLSALQVLPTLELARIGHREMTPPTPADWNFVVSRALGHAPISATQSAWNWSDLQSFFVPGAALSWGTLNENFAYIGLVALLLGITGVFCSRKAKYSTTNEVSPDKISSQKTSQTPNLATSTPQNYAVALALFGLLYALATPLAQFFFFGFPGVAQMGGTGRALLLWSLGLALLAGFGLDFGRARIKSGVFVPLVFVLVGAELFFNGFLTQPTAPRAQIYPPTTLTTFLAKNSAPDARVLMLTPQRDWLPTEGFRAPKTHPQGILPPNGAMVYGIYDVNGYDSLSLRVYRAFIGSAQQNGPSPALNGNMVLLDSPTQTLLDSLAVRWVVTPQGEPLRTGTGQKVLSANGCDVWKREISGPLRVSGASFAPGWRDGKYQPQSFRLGGFVSLCALAFVAASLGFKWSARFR
ncbi:YfhO family protein [Abditibacterium utsteinense]|nr:YfhO family protein [Abditibacterium utsteinense]